ncbi:endogenous retrovirus group K member 6 Env polyprotein-like [Myotis yumanensis]|uniref:endogenous retrovirus group K member 6 Env polyprotein-like n=1 Tax=Myotis yumanensis TaxID=159337 RepID=UPI0038D4E113
MASKRKRDETELEDRLAQLTIQEGQTIRTRLPRTRNTSPPTWGQVKRLCQEGERLVTAHGKPCTSSTLFVAMLAILTAQVKGLNYTYWAYIPNPPLMRGVSWTDVTVPIYTNDSNWMPGPFDDRGPMKPEEEGTRMYNYSTGVIGMPVCLGLGDHCLQLYNQAWLSMAKNTTNSEKHHNLFILSALGLRGKESDRTDMPPTLPVCQTPIHTHSLEWVQWTRCRGKKARVLVNNPYGRIIDWSPFGSARTLNSGKVLRWHIGNYSISTNAKETIRWHGGGFAPPSPYMEGAPMQNHLWKLGAALKPIKFWTGKLENVSGEHSMTWYRNSTRGLQACVHIPYLLLKGPVQWNPTTGEISCFDCTLLTCVNNSVPFNHNRESLYLLRARTGVWLPVRMDRRWQESSLAGALQAIAEGILKRSKRFIGIIIAAILGLIAVTATAATAGVALQRSVQTATFVQEWHKDSEQLWSSQRKIDSEINEQIADLEQTVALLGDQIVSLQRRLQLKCDWNHTGLCITPVPYNETAFPWDKVKKHLLNHGNLTQEILDLQDHIHTTFQKKLEEVTGQQVLQDLINEIQNMNPIPHFQALVGTSSGLLLLVLILCFVLYLVCRRSRKAVAVNNQRSAIFYVINLKQNKKGGKC